MCRCKSVLYKVKKVLLISGSRVRVPARTQKITGADTPLINKNADEIGVLHKRPVEFLKLNRSKN